MVFSPIQDVPSFSDPLHVRQRSVLRSRNPRRCGRRCWRWRRLWGILPSKMKIHIYWIIYIYSTYTLCMYIIIFNIICTINIYQLCTQRFTCFDYKQSGSTHGGSTIKHGCANEPLNTTQASPSTHSCPLQNHGFGPRCCDSVTPSCNAAQFWDMPNQTQSYQRISTFRKSQDSLRWFGSPVHQGHRTISHHIALGRWPALEACGSWETAFTIWLKLFESSKPAPWTAMKTKNLGQKLGPKE